MFEKRLKMVFITIFLAMIAIPLLSTNLKEGTISTAENRTLAAFPALHKEDGTLNRNWNADFETWINDNIGLRSQMVTQNAKIQYHVFHVLSNNSDMLLGANGELNYATLPILVSYQHLNLKSEYILDQLAAGFQFANDYLAEKGIQMYYFQCWDKQSIYPEHFPKTVIQYGDISKTDQIVDTLTSRTTVSVVSPKAELIAAKDQYDTYSLWGDPTHWTQRGAYIGYQQLMRKINDRNGGIYPVLTEEDYTISQEDMGYTLFGGIHEECILENFQIRQPRAEVTNEKLTLLGEDQRHIFYTNPGVDNKTRVLVLGDSYFNNFLMDDLAESFHEVFIIWGDYSSEFADIIDEYKPDIVIVENAERCDRTNAFAEMALSIQASQGEAPQ